MRYSFIFLALILLAPPTAGQAQTTAFSFAKSASPVIGEYLPDAVVGPPDRKFFSLPHRGDAIRITFANPSTASLLLWHRSSISFTQARFVFEDSNGKSLTHLGHVLPLTSSGYLIPYTSASPYQAVRIQLAADEPLEIDAIGQTVEKLFSVASVPTLVAGNLVKLYDDGDQKTSYDATVYFIGSDGKRHPFVDPRAFTTWNFSAEHITEVDRITLFASPLGEDIPLRPGSFLIKLPSSPDVYSISGIGKLSKIPDETHAMKWFGPEWNQRILDISLAAFSSYIMAGEDIHPLEHASLRYPDGTTTYVYRGFEHIRKTGSSSLETFSITSSVLPRLSSKEPAIPSLPF